jgi:hypothetical protein
MTSYLRASVLLITLSAALAADGAASQTRGAAPRTIEGNAADDGSLFTPAEREFIKARCGE